MPDHHWRQLPLETASGEKNMARDRALLDQCIAGQSPPILRFYRWQPTAISLGYHQRQWPAHWANLTVHGEPLTVVRRPSGGRAVLHHRDLTYALVMPWTGRSRLTSYRLICDSLIQAWQHLGIPLHYGTAGRGYIHHPSCWGTATAADLLTPEGYKLIGSAQLRRGPMLLQHGSIALRPDPTLYHQIFGEPMPGSIPPALAAFASEERDDQIMDAIAVALATQFAITFERSSRAAEEADQCARR